MLERLAAIAPEEADRYGTGEPVERLEARVATLLGKEAAVFMPSGTMAQQIALRIHADRRGLRTVAFHPTSHLELHEEKAYERLHGLHATLVGAPTALLTLADLERVREPLAALLLELPQREIGGRLPEWHELEAQAAWARERNVALHLDGARLWEAAPYYERPHSEIAGLFDTVYVSFYKGLGGIAGCALAGPGDVIAEARVWQARHGGRLLSLYPLVLSAELGLDRFLPRMPEYHRHAVAVGAELNVRDGIEVVPDPPQTPMMHVHLRGDRERLIAAAVDLAEERKVWLFDRLRVTALPTVCVHELGIGEASLTFTAAEIAALYGEVVERAAK